MFKDLYNINSKNFEYVTYRSQDIYLDENNSCKTFKEGVGKLKVIQSDTNKISCKSSIGYSFNKKVISGKKPKVDRLNGLCNQIAKSYTFNFNRILTTEILENFSKFDVTESWQCYMESCPPDKYLQIKYGDKWQEEKERISKEYQKRNELLNSGKIAKIPFSSKDLKKEFVELFDSLVDCSLWEESRATKDFPKSNSDYAILYLLHCTQWKKNVKTEYNKRKNLFDINLTDCFIPINQIWTFYRIPEYCSYTEFVKKVQEVYENNIRIIESYGISGYFPEFLAWNYVKNFSYNKNDPVFKKYLTQYNKKRTSTWACLDKNYALKESLILLSTKKYQDYLELKDILGLTSQIEILYDSLKKEYIIPIKFQEKIYSGTIQYLQNIIDYYNLNVNCSELYSNTTIANLDNESLYVINLTSLKQAPTDKQKVVYKEYSSPALNHIANPFKFPKMKKLSGIEIPLENKFEIKHNPYSTGSKKKKILISKQGEKDYKENQNTNKLVGVEFLPFLENCYLGKKINKKCKVVKQVNNLLKKNGKTQISKEIPQGLLNIIIANFAKAGLDITTYNYNIITTDPKTKRLNQAYYLGSNVRAMIIQKSIIEFYSNTDLSGFGSKDNFENELKVLTRYETALAFYKVINEEFFGLEKVKMGNGKYTGADICLSYETNIQKIRNAFDNLSNIKTEGFILESEGNPWSKNIINGISKDKLEELKILYNSESYNTSLTEKAKNQILAIRDCFNLSVKIIILYIKKVISKINDQGSELLKSILTGFLPKYHYFSPPD